MSSKFHNHNRHSTNHYYDRLKVQRMSESIVPNVYASIILAMYDELKLDPDDIERCVIRSQQIWDDANENGWDMKANCEELTGIVVTLGSSRKEI